MSADYVRAENAARALLLSQRAPRIPITAWRLTFDRSITIGSMSHFCTVTSTSIDQISVGTGCLRDGCTLIRRKNGITRYIVLYNDRSASLRRRNFTLAHELGHIFLGHERDTAREELEANHFASELILPRVLALAFLSLLPDGTDHASALAEAFGVSLGMAKIRLGSLRRHIPPAEDESALLERYQRLFPAPGQPYVTY